jgi:hypothetical protein
LTPEEETMFKTVAVLILAVLATPVSTVPHQAEQAPSMETCVAYLNSWSSGLDGIPFGDQVRSALKPLTQGEMFRRLAMLNYCEASSLTQMKAVPTEQRASLDKLGISSGRIQLLREHYMSERSARYFDFVVRHKLLDQFDREDESGER